jgi:hypothetical protein
VNGYRDGNGFNKYIDGSIYQGKWKNNIREGYGVYTYPKNHYYLEYKGNFADDEYQGQGILKFSNGSKY